MRAVIHIGLAKTGSTTIQAFLHENRAALTRQNIRYQRFTPHISSQFELALLGRSKATGKFPKHIEKSIALMIDRAPTRQYLNEFETSFAQSLEHCTEDTYVASSEHISAWLNTPSQINRMHRFLNRFFTHIQYVVYLRRQDELVLSSFSEKLKRGSEAYLAAHSDQRKTYNFWRMTRMWKNAVGGGNFEVRLLEPDYLVDGDLIADFCSFVGIDNRDLVLPLPLNTSLTVGRARNLGRLNRLVPPLTKNNKRIRMHFLLKKLIMHAPSANRRLALDTQQITAIQKANHKSNERLRRDLFPERASLFTSEKAANR